jgi:hypothetical protein
MHWLADHERHMLVKNAIKTTIFTQKEKQTMQPFEKKLL